ncbi:MAG: hypothetical protein IT368_05315 [Candidatus Hydrogenedentes bacterium]|nr:hypothetical protein [Candidatus Hydrogenedentota bacterium]
MVTKVEFVTVYQDREGKRVEVPMNVGKPVDASSPRESRFATDEADDAGDANTLKICLTGSEWNSNGMSRRSELRNTSTILTSCAARYSWLPEKPWLSSAKALRAA